MHTQRNLNAAPDLQFLFGPVILALPAYAHSGSEFTSLVCLTYPQNVSSVSLRSLDPQAAPMIRLNYLQSEANVQKLTTGIKLLRNLFHPSAFDEFRGEKVAPGADKQSEAALEAYIREVYDTVYHPVGICKMGTDAMAVVDPELRVHGIQGVACYRCLHHANDHHRKHERTDYHDCRKSH